MCVCVCERIGKSCKTNLAWLGVNFVTVWTVEREEDGLGLGDLGNIHHFCC